MAEQSILGLDLALHKVATPESLLLGGVCLGVLDMGLVVLLASHMLLLCRLQEAGQLRNRCFVSLV